MVRKVKILSKKNLLWRICITSDIYQCVIPKRKISPQACNLICLETESSQQKCSVNYKVTSKNNICLIPKFFRVTVGLPSSTPAWFSFSAHTMSMKFSSEIRLRCVSPMSGNMVLVPWFRAHPPKTVIPLWPSLIHRLLCASACVRCWGIVFFFNL